MLDYIIVGAGLSGITVAEELLKKGKTIKVFENNSQSSSTVAGGIYNPVILKRFTLAWNAGDQLETAIPFYRELEEKLNVKLVHELPVYRKFNSVEEQNNWFTAMDKPGLSAFLDPKLKSSVNPNISSAFSFGKVERTGRVDTALLLETYRNYLLSSDSLISEGFNYKDLRLENDQVQYLDLKAKRIIFCEGFGIIQNPYFNFLPLHGNKGEYLVIRSKNLQLDVAVKSSVFILPLGNDIYKVGATYDNRDTTDTPTDIARETLLAQLKRMISCDFEVVGQVAGIRPATPDRKPVVGQHPDHEAIFCCNGFGSRGVLIAPVMAQELVNYIEDQKPLPSEIDIKRFYKKS